MLMPVGYVVWIAGRCSSGPIPIVTWSTEQV